jgi:thiamine pyridinylase
LRVALYPFVPDKTGLFAQVEHSFELANPEIDLQIVDLSDNYYDESSPHAITNTESDIFEVDSVFMDDLVDSGRIQPLPRAIVPSAEVFAPVAVAAAQVNGVWYGLPHWLCTNYLFVKGDDPLATVAKLSELKSGISADHAPNKGLLVDLKGRSTLGEIYLDALLDQYRTFDKVAPFLTVDNLNEGTVKDLSDVRTLCDADFCRDSDYHDMEGFYARQFAHQHGRALVGYSERLYYIGQENLTACKKGECIGLPDLALTPLPLSDNGSQPFAWVDSFAVASSCTEQCLSDAQAFLEHAAGIDEVRSTLVPVYGQAPRYLLPALTALYTDKSLLSVAPLYPRLYGAVRQAIAVRGKSLNKSLRDVGKKLDKEKLPN